MPSCGSVVRTRSKRSPLLGKELVLGIVGGREVGVDGVDDDVGARRDLRQRVLEVVVAETEPVHAGVDLEVAAQRHVVAGRSGLERASGAGRRDRRRQIVLEDAVEVADAERAEDQHRCPDARLPQDDGFLDVGAGEHRRPCLLERQRDLRRAVPVAIGLDHRDDPGVDVVGSDHGLTPFGGSVGQTMV